MTDLCEVVITAPYPAWPLDLTRQLVTEGLCASDRGREEPQRSCRPRLGEIIKLIEEDGWYLVAVRGSHRQYKHPEKPGLIRRAQ